MPKMSYLRCTHISAPDLRPFHDFLRGYSLGPPPGYPRETPRDTPPGYHPRMGSSYRAICPNQLYSHHLFFVILVGLSCYLCQTTLLPAVFSRFSGKLIPSEQFFQTPEKSTTQKTSEPTNIREIMDWIQVCHRKTIMYTKASFLV